MYKRQDLFRAVDLFRALDLVRDVDLSCGMAIVLSRDIVLSRGIALVVSVWAPARAGTIMIPAAAISILCFIISSIRMS